WRHLEALKATRRAIIQRPLVGKSFPHSSTEILLYIALGSSCGFVDSPCQSLRNLMRRVGSLSETRERSGEMEIKVGFGLTSSSSGFDLSEGNRVELEVWVLELELLVRKTSSFVELPLLVEFELDPRLSCNRSGT
ncbi:hypothetical protein Drorol1_Dr00017786, partial [Drosera rotundifolia]